MMRRWNGWGIQQLIIRRPMGRPSFLNNGWEKPARRIMKDVLHYAEEAVKGNLKGNKRQKE